MSFVVDISSVKAVLLADRWHLVEDQSFEISEYAFGEPGGRWVPGGGGGVGAPPIGARWTESDGMTIVCPVTSIVALRCHVG
jgi:hypothetical protein